MRRLCLGLPIALAGCVGGGDGDSCSPEGEKIADAHYALSTLTGDADALYYLDWENTDSEGNRGVTLVMRLAKGGGEPEVMVRSEAEEAYAKNRIAVDELDVYYLDHCIPAAPTCARLMRVAKRGGAAQVLVEDRIYDFALHGDSVFYSTSDESGLQGGEPDGTIWRRPKDGGDSSEVVGGLYHLRDIDLDADGILYFTDTAGPELGPWRLRRPDYSLVTFDLQWFAPRIAAEDDAYVYLLADSRIVRVPTQSGEAEPASPPRENGIAAAALFDGVLYGTDNGMWRSEGDDGPSHYECGAVLAVTGGGAAYQELAGETEEANAIWVDDAFVYWSSYRGAVFRTPR